MYIWLSPAASPTEMMPPQLVPPIQWTRLIRFSPSRFSISISICNSSFILLKIVMG